MIDFDYYIDKVREIKPENDADKMYCVLQSLIEFAEKSEIEDKEDFIQTIEKTKQKLYNTMWEATFNAKKAELLEYLQNAKIKNTNIFIVHGRNEKMKNEVVLLLERLRIKNTVLDEQQKRDKTITESFFNYANACNYSIVLYSADDLGYLKSESSKSKQRARENVLFELGFFMGKIKEKNIIVLKEQVEDFEFPSDIKSLNYIPYAINGLWKSKLIFALQRAGIKIEQSLIAQIQ